MAEIYSVKPYDAGSLVKDATVAYRFSIEDEEGGSAEVFYAGQITMLTAGGTWIKFEDGEMKFPLHPAEYFDRWFFITSK